MVLCSEVVFDILELVFHVSGPNPPQYTTTYTQQYIIKGRYLLICSTIYYKAIILWEEVWGFNFNIIVWISLGNIMYLLVYFSLAIFSQIIVQSYTIYKFFLKLFLPIGNGIECIKIYDIDGERSQVSFPLISQRL